MRFWFSKKESGSDTLKEYQLWRSVWNPCFWHATTSTFAQLKFKKRNSRKPNYFFQNQPPATSTPYSCGDPAIPPLNWVSKREMYKSSKLIIMQRESRLCVTRYRGKFLAPQESPPPPSNLCLQSTFIKPFLFNLAKVKDEQ
jgi:hypothetical protein